MNYSDREKVVNSGGGSLQAREARQDYRDSRENEEDNDLKEHMFEDVGFLKYIKENNIFTFDASEKTMKELWDMYISDMEDDNEG